MKIVNTEKTFEGFNTDRYSEFKIWMKRKYPETNLVKWQKAIAKQLLNLFELMGKQDDKTFILEKLLEFETKKENEILRTENNGQ